MSSQDHCTQALVLLEWARGSDRSQPHKSACEDNVTVELPDTGSPWLVEI